jgi:hypothetical protein
LEPRTQAAIPFNGSDAVAATAMLKEIKETSEEYKKKRGNGGKFPTAEEAISIASNNVKDYYLGIRSIEELNKAAGFIQRLNLQHEILDISGVKPQEFTNDQTNAIPPSYASIDWLLIGYILWGNMTQAQRIGFRKLPKNIDNFKRFFTEGGFEPVNVTGDFPPPWQLSASRMAQAVEVYCSALAAYRSGGKCWADAPTCVGMAPPSVEFAAQVWEDLKIWCDSDNQTKPFKASAIIYRMLKGINIHMAPWDQVIDIKTVIMKQGLVYENPKRSVVAPEKCDQDLFDEINKSRDMEDLAAYIKNGFVGTLKGSSKA